MRSQLVPHDVKKAIALLQAYPAHAWTATALAVSCGTPRRTLEKHFRRFVGEAPLAYLRTLRLEQAHAALLRAPPGANVTAIATQCGFNHLGRFAIRYRMRYRESPSVTMLRAKHAADEQVLDAPVLAKTLDRPAIGVLRFDLIGPETQRAGWIGDHIAAALCRHRWVTVVPPGSARYHLRGSVREDGAGRLRVMIALVDAATGRYLGQPAGMELPSPDSRTSCHHMSRVCSSRRCATPKLTGSVASNTNSSARGN